MSIDTPTAISQAVVPGREASTRFKTVVNTVDNRGFFSPIPRAVYDHRAQGRLQTRDVEVLGLLLDYKGRQGTVVRPRQDTLAARLRCSVDTVQRSVKRLQAAGLLVATRLRDAMGRLGHCVYDLAGTLSLMPRHAAKLRSGGWGVTEPVSAPKNDAQRPAEALEAMPQGCGVLQADSEPVVEADNTASTPVQAARTPTPASPVVGNLIALGITDRRAAQLTARYGEGRCREVLAALEAMPRVKNKAAWCLRCLSENWTLSQTVTARPKAQIRYRPLVTAAPAASTLCADPLTDLPAAEAERLEAAARAALIGELPLLRASLEAGRSRALVTKRMREMLTARVGEGRGA